MQLFGLVFTLKGSESGLMVGVIQIPLIMRLNGWWKNCSILV